MARLALKAGACAWSTEPRRQKRSVIGRVLGGLALGGFGAGIIAFVHALAMIARDEATHAELGWSVLAWCLDKRGVRAAVAARVAKRTVSSTRCGSARSRRP